MKFFVDVKYCKYAHWNFFGLLRSKVETKPFEVAIISEEGECYTSCFSSIKHRWRIMDRPSFDRFDEVCRQGGFTKKVHDEFDIASGISDLILRASEHFVHELYAINEMDGFLPELFRKYPGEYIFIPQDVISVISVRHELIEEMDDLEFDMDSSFLYHIYLEPGQHYSHIQKTDMFISHPDWPVNNSTDCFARAKWAKKAITVIDSIKNHRNATRR